MVNENTEIPDLYDVYPKNYDFIYDKRGRVLLEEKCENNPDLYDVYSNRDEFTGDLLAVELIKGSKKMSNRKYRVFLETEYLEGLYEEIAVFISANKTITIEAMFSKGCENLPNKFTCVIPIEYPLVPPFVYMNDVLYMSLINCCHLERVKVIVSKYSRSYRGYLNCISCASVLKRENWRCETMFSHIFLEWGRIREMKRIVGYELALEDLMIYRGLEYIHIVCIMEYLDEFG